MYINGYDVLAEFGCLLLAVLILYLMLFTNPRKTATYMIDFIGMLSSVFLILLHMLVFALSSNVEGPRYILFVIVCFLFLMAYDFILNVLFLCIRSLSSKQINYRKTYQYMAVGAAIYGGIMLYLMITGRFFYVEDNRIHFTWMSNLYLIFGMLDDICCWIVSLCRKHTVPKAFRGYLRLFLAAEMVLLVVQLIFQHTVLVSLTYVLPFLIMYVMLHSNPYDEVSGCQNAYSYETRVNEHLHFHKKFAMVYIMVPELRKSVPIYSDSQIYDGIVERCRRIEHIPGKIRMYKINDYTFGIMIRSKSVEKSREIIYRINDDMGANASRDVKEKLDYKMIAFLDAQNMGTLTALDKMYQYLLDKIKEDTNYNYYIATEQDYKDFQKTYQIVQLLQDIQAANNLEDERVLCYAQPIYDVKNQSFRTAEALMRLKMEGEIIYPDKFITLAERMGCMHTLTRIMVNKVCRIAKSLEMDYDFSAITINCSTIEFDNENFHSDILEIIRKHDLDCSRIRLELTESAMVEDFNAVMQNMTKLVHEGVKFYLDDFGTGYSNLERILTCPFMTVKFDKSLLYKSLEDQVVNEVLVSMVNVFKKNGLVVLIEGVEDEEHNTFSIERGFDYIQGYKYSVPVPIMELVKYFDKREQQM